MNNKLPLKQVGAVLIFAAMWIVILLGFVGIVVDLSLAYNVKQELKHATNSAALAAGIVLYKNQDDYQHQVQTYLNSNPILGKIAQIESTRLGVWQDSNHAFVDLTQSSNSFNTPNAIEVTTSFTYKTIFLRLFSSEFNSFKLQAKSIATDKEAKPLSIVIVLDISQNMDFVNPACTLPTAHLFVTHDAIDYLQQSFLNASALIPDKLGLVLVSSTVKLKKKLTKKYSKIVKAIPSQFSATLPATIELALNSAQKELQSKRSKNRKKIILIIHQAQTWIDSNPVSLMQTFKQENIYPYSLTIGNSSRLDFGHAINTYTDGKSFFTNCLDLNNFSLIIDSIYQSIITGQPRLVQ